MSCPYVVFYHCHFLWVPGDIKAQDQLWVDGSRRVDGGGDHVGGEGSDEGGDGCEFLEGGELEGGLGGRWP